MNIPNILSIIRIFLVPLFTYEFICNDNYILAGILLLISGVTDCLDGYIARKYNMITNLGKILDPVADKLTQVMAVLCLAVKGHTIMWYVLAFLVFKDIAMMIGGITLYKNKDMVVSANWYGKISTIVFYFAVIFISLFHSYIPDLVTSILASIVLLVLIGAFIGYVFYFFSIRSKKIQ